MRQQRHPLLFSEPGVTTWLKHLEGLFQDRSSALDHPPPGLSAALPFAHSPTPSAADAGNTHTADRLSEQRGRRVFSARTLTCPHCAPEFGSLGALRVHISAKHTDSSATPEPPEPTMEQQAADNPETQSAASLRRSLQQHSEAVSMTILLPPRLHLCDLQTWLHASQGLCICRHCGRECYSWDDLKVHIFSMPPAVSRLHCCESHENRFVLVWQERFQVLRPTSWESIAISIRAEVTDFKHRCPICDQWLIQARGLGHHFAAYHPHAVSALTRHNVQDTLPSMPLNVLSSFLHAA